MIRVQIYIYIQVPTPVYPIRGCPNGFKLLPRVNCGHADARTHAHTWVGHERRSGSCSRHEPRAFIDAVIEARACRQTAYGHPARGTHKRGRVRNVYSPSLARGRYYTHDDSIRFFSPPRPRGSTSARGGLLSDIIPPRPPGTTIISNGPKTQKRCTYVVCIYIIYVCTRDVLIRITVFSTREP